MTLSLILTNTYFVGTPDHATVTIEDLDELPAPVTIARISFRRFAAPIANTATHG